MKKQYLFFLLAATLTAMPMKAADDVDKEDIEAELNTVSITVCGTQVHLTGAEGKTLEIFNLAGVRVGSLRIDSEDKTLNLNLARGCYILKVGKVVRKISIR